MPSKVTPGASVAPETRLRVLEAENKVLRANCDTLAAQIQRANASY